MLRLLLALGIGLATGAAARDLPVPRPAAGSGSVISRVTGESVRFVAEPDFRALVLGQDLLGGDLVRTGPAGAVGILFADRTVMRLHPNTELVVNSVTASAASLTLLSGTLWARAPRDAADLRIATPTAAAAVRGTDWALSVAGDGTTRLTVYDGAVELANDLGRVTAAGGEAAIAQPGRAPVKVRVANRSALPQMLFTLTPADAAAPIAEVADDLARGDTPDTPDAPDALARYRAAQALLRRGDSAAAAAAFDAARPGLGPERRAAAAWLAALARAEAGAPFRRPAPSGTRIDAVGAAMEAALIGDYARTDASLERLGDTPSALAAAVQVAIIQDDAARAGALVARLKRAAPGSIAALEAEAHYRADVLGDAATAAALLRRALARDPDRPDLWNALGLAEDAADHPLEAEAAFRRALALAPADRAASANLAILLLDSERAAEARALAEGILARDPGSYLGLRALGRAELQSGAPKATDTLLEALAAQPAAAETSIALALASYQDGDETRAQQELDAAARLDPNDPIAPLARSIIALDHARADEAIAAAQEAARLYRGQNAGRRIVAADRETGSSLAAAFSAIGLDGWARFTADRTYDPLSAASLFGEATLSRQTLGRGGPSADGGDMALVQGLILDPLAASYRLRYTDLLRRPFLDAELSAGRTDGTIDATSRSVTLQGFQRLPAPLAFSATLSRSSEDGPVPPDDDSLGFGSLLLGTQFGARAGLFGILGRDTGDSDSETPLGFGLGNRDATDRDSDSIALGGYYRLAGRHVLTAYLTASHETRTDVARRFAVTGGDLLRLDIDSRQDTHVAFAGLGYRGEDDSGTSFAGIEAARTHRDLSGTTTVTSLLLGGTTVLPGSEAEAVDLARIYLGRRQRIGDSLDAEGLLALDWTDGDRETSARAALGWRPAPDQWLRLGVVDEAGPDRATLAPVSTLGLVALRLPARSTGHVRGAILRWDAQLGDRLFLGLEHQSLRFGDVVYATADPLTDVTMPDARLDATTARADYWLGHGVGLFASLSHADSEIRSGPNRGERLPETPDWTARFGLGWMHPAQIRARIEADWTSAQFSGDPADPIDPVWTVDAGLSWEPLDRHLALSIEARNLFDADLEQAWGGDRLGRSIAFSATARF